MREQKHPLVAQAQARVQFRVAVGLGHGGCAISLATSRLSSRGDTSSLGK